MSHPFSFPAAPAAPVAGIAAPVPAVQTTADDFFAKVKAGGEQGLPYATPGNYPRLVIKRLKRVTRFDGDNQVVCELEVAAPPVATEPTAPPPHPVGAMFGQHFVMRHTPAVTSLLNLVASLFAVPVSTITADHLKHLIPPVAPAGQPQAACMLDGAGVEVSGLFFSAPKKNGELITKVRWGVVPGRSWADLQAAAKP